MIKAIKYSFSLIGYFFYYHELLFCALEKTESPLLTRKKSNSKSPSRRTSGVAVDNTGDFSPFMGISRIAKVKPANDFMASSVTVFQNPMLFKFVEDNFENERDIISEKIRKKEKIICKK